MLCCYIFQGMVDGVSRWQDVFAQILQLHGMKKVDQDMAQGMTL